MKTNNINDLVYGHAQAKKVLQVLLKRSYNRYYDKCVLGVQGDVPAPLKCLLIGPSGTGKTHLMHSLAKLHKFPLLCIDATQLMPTGNSDGINAKQLTKRIKERAEEYLKENADAFTIEGVLNRMVVFVDEFDKLGLRFDSTGNWNQQVQACFLTLIDDKGELSGVSWVFAGAFTGLHEDKATPRNNLGFFPAASEEQTKEITDQDIIKSGIIPEMLGRISLIVQLDTFTEADYDKILTNMLDSFPELSLNDIERAKIVSKAIKSGQGVRSLTRQLEMMQVDVEFNEVRL